MHRKHRLAVVLAGAIVLGACAGGSVDRPEFTAPGPTEGNGMKLTSDAFRNEERIPTTYTCDGADVSPPLTIADIPPGTVTLAIVVDDPDAPRGTWDHWVAYDVSPTGSISEGAGSVGTPGKNSWGAAGYRGPCPPSGSHRYFFTVYALDANLGLAAGADKATLLGAIEGHVIDEATLMGRYSR
jgi:Raf kinase inhibitor-like YbhB/YbcL family protein